ELKARAAVSAHLLFDGESLGDADARRALGLGAGESLDLLRLTLAEDARALGFGLGERLDLRRLLLGPRILRLALVLLRQNRELRFRDRRLLLGARLGLAQLALLHRRLLLTAVGLYLLLGDLPRA